ncbi:MAG: N-acetylneuraminate synthase family protein [Alphaproteobacteria bacterium]
MRYDTSFRVNARTIAADQSTYFIADIAANHDGDLERAKALIWLAKDAGADAAKFQHFQAARIVSDRGFRRLGNQLGHQAGWNKSVFEIYEDYSLNRDWNEVLAATAAEAGIDFMTTPYDQEATDSIAPLVPAFKIGSGDITWTDAIAHIAAKGIPVFLATGASTLADVERAVDRVLRHNRKLCLMQCNTNYTGRIENIRHVNLRVLQHYAMVWPGLPLGLSDHTPGHATVLGAVALGARAVEKHFTDDSGRSGPDHPFSMTPEAWRTMVARTRELEAALGDGIKRIEENERETAVIQRRALHAARDLAPGHVLQREDLEALRPAPVGAFAPYEAEALPGRVLTTAKEKGEPLFAQDLESSDDPR